MFVENFDAFFSDGGGHFIAHFIISKQISVLVALSNRDKSTQQGEFTVAIEA